MISWPLLSDPNRYFATLDNSTDVASTCYPTNVVVANELLTVWSGYHGGPAQRAKRPTDDVVPAVIKMARTALPSM